MPPTIATGDGHVPSSASGGGTTQPDIDLEKATDEADSSTPSRETSGALQQHGPGDQDDQAENDDAYKVDWTENDRENPRNWSATYKAWITFQLGMLALAASLGSSIMAPAETALGRDFGLAREATILVISLYVLGFACGPLLWAPVSEAYGRKWSMIPAMFVLGLFSIGTATSQTPAAVFITRFFGGVFGSAPVANVAAALGDIYEPQARGTAVVFYAIAVVGGPTIGPVIGSALTADPRLGWRWTEYIQAIWTFTIVVLTLFCMPEVFAPVLLARRARKLRKDTSNTAYWHPHENLKLDVRSVITKHLNRPLLMLFTEPMVTCIALYASFVFGLLYLTLEVFPIVFLGDRQWGAVVSTLPFLGLFVGILCAVPINLANQPRYIRIVNANKGRPVPEARLLPMAIGGFLFAIGLFWFGWTAAPKYHWMIPTTATAFIGAGFNVIFQQCINFLVDTYGLYAASAVSANTFLRSLLACAFPLVARSMFSIGVGPAMSILGGVATLALPVPFIFMRYGLTLRKMSKFAPVHED